MENIPSKLQVSIGIPAYNEEANIKRLLESIIRQQEINFKLDKIFVISDGSDDNTVAQALSVNDPRINVIDQKDRKGKAARQNEIIDIVKEGYLIFLDGDILLKNDDCLAKMLEPMMKNPKIGLISTKASPLPATSFLEKVLNFSLATKEKIFELINNSKNIYFSRGTARVFSPEFLKIFFWGAVKGGEDAYAYLACITNGFEFEYSKNAEIFFQSPRNLRDYFKQSTRFFANRQYLEKVFGKDLVEKEFYLPKRTLFKVIFREFFNHPILFVSYAMILICSRILSIKSKSVATWSQATSSKILKK